MARLVYEELPLIHASCNLLKPLEMDCYVRGDISMGATSLQACALLAFLSRVGEHLVIAEFALGQRTTHCFTLPNRKRKQGETQCFLWELSHHEQLVILFPW